MRTTVRRAFATAYPFGKLADSTSHSRLLAWGLASGRLLGASDSRNDTGKAVGY